MKFVSFLRNCGPNPRLPLGLVIVALAFGCSRTESRVSAQAGGEVGTAGRLVCPSPEMDFGVVFEGAVVERRFDLEVTGGSPIAIEHVRPSCGCTRAELSIASNGDPYQLGAELAPGTKLWLDTTFETLGRPGQQVKPIGLYGEFESGVLEVALRASVQQLLTPEPELLDFGKVLPSGSVGGEFVLRIADKFEGSETVFLELDADILSSQLDLALDPIEPRPDGSSDRFRLKVSTKVGLAAGYRNYRIPVRIKLAGGEGDPQAEYSGEAIVRAHILGMAEAQPLSLSLGSLRAGQISAATGRISVYGEVPDLLGIEPTIHVTSGTRPISEYFKVDLERAEPNGSGGTDGGQVGQERAAYTVTLRANGLPADVRGVFRGRIVYELGLAAQSEVVIGFQGVGLGE